jgi:hypothetical protein
MKYGRDFINLNNKVVERNRKAEQLILGLKENFYASQNIYPIIREYLCLKFSLDPEETFFNEDIIYLAKISIKKAASENEIYWDRKDCHGATESMTKKVLFITSIERYLGFSFSQNEYLKIDTIKDLSDSIYRHLSEMKVNLQ